MKRFVVAAMFVLWSVNVSSAPAIGGLIFSDDFNTENGGQPFVGGSSGTNPPFTKWDVISGNVDLIDHTWFLDPIAPASGLFVDLSGSGAKGHMQTKDTFSLNAGVYELSFLLAGSQIPDAYARGDNQNSTVEVKFGDVYFETFVLQRLDPFQIFTRVVELNTTFSGKLSIQHVSSESGGDNFSGPLLDNVQISQTSPVPEPSSLALLATGCLSLFRYGWRRKRKLVA